MIKKNISFRGSSIQYMVAGQGKPVVLLHGLGEDGHIWNQQKNYLKEKNLLVIPDLPGSGHSPLQEEANSMEDYAACINAIIAHERITHFSMIGHSMGGYITLAYLEKYPSQLTSFGLFHSSAYADDVSKIETRKKAIEFIEANGSGAFLKTSIPGLFNDPVKHRPEIEELVHKGHGFQQKALVQYYTAMINRPDRATLLKNTTIPFLLVAGAFDKAVPFKHSLEQCHLAHCTHFEILRNSAHMGMLEETEKANQILANFLHNIPE